MQSICINVRANWIVVIEVCLWFFFTIPDPWLQVVEPQRCGVLAWRAGRRRTGTTKSCATLPKSHLAHLSGLGFSRCGARGPLPPQVRTSSEQWLFDVCSEDFKLIGQAESVRKPGLFTVYEMWPADCVYIYNILYIYIVVVNLIQSSFPLLTCTQ